MLGLGLAIGMAPHAHLARYSLGGKAPAILADYASGAYALNGQGCAFSDLHDFSRTNTGWRRDGLGNWVPVTSASPRTGHHIWKGGQLVPAGILLEPSQHSNLLGYSEDLTQGSAWVTSGTTALTATHLQEDSSDGYHRLNQTTHGLVSGEIYTMQGVFTPAGRSTLCLREALQGGIDIEINLTAGTVSVINGMDIIGVPYIEARRGGGYFVAISGVLSTGTDWAYELCLADDAGQPSYLGDGVSGLLVEDLQLVAGAVPLSQVPTESAAVSIAGESLSFKPAALSETLAAAGGGMPAELTLVIKGTMSRSKDPVSYANTVPIKWRLSSDDYIDLIISTYDTHTGRPYFRINSGGTKSEVSGENVAYEIGVEHSFSLAMVIGGGLVEGFYNGAATGQTSISALPDLLGVPWEIFPTGAAATVQEFLVWPEALPVAQVQAATA